MTTNSELKKFKQLYGLMNLMQPSKTKKLMGNIGAQAKDTLSAYNKRMQGNRISTVGQIKGLQQWENFHLPVGTLQSAHTTADRYFLLNLLTQSEIGDYVLPTGSKWVDADKRMNIRDAMWHVRFQASGTYTVFIYLSVGTTGSTNPTNQLIARDDTKSNEELLDGIFTSGEHDFSMFVQRASAVPRPNGSSTLYEFHQSFAFKDLLQKIQQQFYNPQDETVRTYNLWALTYSRSVITINISQSINVIGKITLARSRLV